MDTRKLSLSQEPLLKEGGGVDFYIKQGIKFRIIEELTLFENKIIETMFIEI